MNVNWRVSFNKPTSREFLHCVCFSSWIWGNNDDDVHYVLCLMETDVSSDWVAEVCCFLIWWAGIAFLCWWGKNFEEFQRYARDNLAKLLIAKTSLPLCLLFFLWSLFFSYHSFLGRKKLPCSLSGFFWLVKELNLCETEEQEKIKLHIYRVMSFYVASGRCNYPCLERLISGMELPGHRAHVNLDLATQSLF